MRIVMIGYGTIGQGLTPLLRKHFPDVKDILAISADWRGQGVADLFGVELIVAPLRKSSYFRVLAHHLRAGDVMINVSVNVSSLALIEWCQSRDVLYMDTCVEPWAGEYLEKKFTNHVLRSQVLALRDQRSNGWRQSPTALVANGANPGLVSHLARKGLEELGKIKGVESWTSHADLARKIGVRVVHIAERDTQSDGIVHPKNAFVNTWSVEGFISELCLQPAEMGWGSHEGKEVPGVKFQVGSKGAACLPRTGLHTRVKSWVPSHEEQECHLVTHHESLSIADFLTIQGDYDEVVYRPSVYYAYHPCDSAMESIERMRTNGVCATSLRKAVMRDPTTGHDELGVLFIYDGGAYWYGSTLTAQEAHSLAPCNNATSLQVVATMISSLSWILQHPNEGVIEAEDLDHEAILEGAMPYLGKVRGVETNWQPAGKNELQLKHFLI